VELSNVQSALTAELEKTQGLDGRLQALQAEAQETARKLAASAARESALADKTREHEHDLHAVRARCRRCGPRRAATARACASSRSRSRTTTERTGSSRRSNTRTTADGLEFKLGKL
jgi:hypothetical protein